MTWLNVSKIPVGLVAACAAVAVSLSACGGEAQKMPMSEAFPGWQDAQSKEESADDVVGMSGQYEVMREGKLLRYAGDPRLEKPELSEVAKVNDNNGAEAFARYFIKVVEYTWDSGDSTLLREISLPSCEWCEYVASSTEQREADKGWVRNLRATIIDVQPAFEVPEYPGLWHVETVVETEAHQEYDGTELKEVGKERTRLAIQIRHGEDGWEISSTKGESVVE